MPDNAGSSGTDSTDSSDEAESDNLDEDRDYCIWPQMMNRMENMMDGIPILR